LGTLGAVADRCLKPVLSAASWYSLAIKRSIPQVVGSFE
jgi:hypothetical protein